MGERADVNTRFVEKPDQEEEDKNDQILEEGNEMRKPLFMTQNPVTKQYQQPLWPDTYLWNLMGDLKTQKRPFFSRGDAHKNKSAEAADRKKYDKYLKEAEE